MKSTCTELQCINAQLLIMDNTTISLGRHSFEKLGQMCGCTGFKSGAHHRSYYNRPFKNDTGLFFFGIDKLSLI